MRNDFASFVGWAEKPAPKYKGRAFRPTQQELSLNSATPNFVIS